MMPTDRDIFFATFDMWSEKVSLLSSITPRYRKESTIDGLQLRHSFFPPKRLDVKTPLQTIGRYRKSMYNSFSGHV